MYGIPIFNHNTRVSLFNAGIFCNENNGFKMFSSVAAQLFWLTPDRVQVLVLCAGVRGLAVHRSAQHGVARRGGVIGPRDHMVTMALPRHELFTG